MTPLDHFKAFLESINYSGKPEEYTIDYQRSRFKKVAEQPNRDVVAYTLDEQAIDKYYEGYIGFSYTLTFDKSTGELFSHGGYE